MVLIWVQTVCKGYQQKTNISTSRERVCKVTSKILSLKTLLLDRKMVHTNDEDLVQTASEEAICSRLPLFIIQIL